jgi:hypothetical protein
MAQEKQLTSFEQAVLDTAIELDMDVKAVRRFIDAFFSVTRARLVEKGFQMVLPGFGAWAPKWIAPRKWKIGQTVVKTTKHTVGVSFRPARGMVVAMRKEWKAGKWPGWPVF